MAKWVSANLANLLPGEVDSIFDAIEAVTAAVSVPLSAVQSAMNTAKLFLVSLDPLDFISSIQSMIESFRNNVVGSGFYILDMWDYPVKMLQPTSYGPTNTVGAINTQGATFEDSFQQDLIYSFEDEKDTNRPQFSGPVAMMVVVTGKGTIDDLNVMPEEDNLSDAWKGFAASIENAGRALQEKRWKASFETIRTVAEAQLENKVSVRVQRAQRAFTLLGHMTRDELDVIPIPMDPGTGKSFFEDVDTIDIQSAIDWQDDVVPILEAIETNFDAREYPDWERATLYEVYPDLATILDTIFDAVIDLFQKGTTIYQAVIDLIDAIQNKLDELDRLIEQIDEMVEQLEAFLNATGMHVLFLTSNDGVEDLQTQIENATDLPFSGRGFYAGMAVLVGGPKVDAFKTLFSPIADTTEGTADP